MWCLELARPVSVSVPAAEAADLIVRNGRIADANDAAATLLGRRSGYDLRGHRLHDLLVREPDSLRKVLVDFISSDYRLTDCALQIGAGSEARALVHSLTGVIEHGALMRIWGVQRRATNCQVVPDQFFQLQKMASVGRVAGSVAHDFNNLLTAILGYGEMVSESLEPASVCQRDMDQVLTAARRAEKLTRQLLTFNLRQRDQTESFDLHDSLVELEPLVRRLIPEGIEISISAASNPALVRGDRGQLELAIINLAVNARDAMPDGGRLTIGTVVGGDDGDASTEVRLTVSDTGTGMPEDVRLRIFDPFFTTRPGAVGLGLSTVHDIVVSQCGGTIEVESEPGHGTTFVISLKALFDVRDPGQPATVASIEGYRSRQDA
jgi:two-component system cell cycle sensor histidine kinase/response regulator CckA